MNQSNQLAYRCREVLLDGKWIADTNYQEVIRSVDYRQASTQVNDLNTIAKLTFHVNYYVAGVLHALQSGKLEIHDKYSFDFNGVKSEEEWQKMIDEFVSNSEQFVLAVEQINDDQLEEVFIDEKYGSYRRNIEGMIEHCYYHLGQLSLIRKMVNSK